jgi:hypothetical protein
MNFFNIILISWFVFQSCLLVLSDLLSVSICRLPVSEAFFPQQLQRHHFKHTVSRQYLRVDHRTILKTVHTGEHDLVARLNALIH